MGGIRGRKYTMTIKCRFCKGEAIRDIPPMFGKYESVICRNCGLIQSKWDGKQFDYSDYNYQAAGDVKDDQEIVNVRRLLGLLYASTYNHQYTKLTEHIDFSSLKSVFDLGCAEGGFLSVLKHHHSQLSCKGIDPDNLLITMGRQAHPEIDLECAAIEGYGGADTYDLVTDFGCYYRADEPDAAIKKVFDLLNPGGYWVVNLGWDSENLNELGTGNNFDSLFFRLASDQDHGVKITPAAEQLADQALPYFEKVGVVYEAFFPHRAKRNTFVFKRRDQIDEGYSHRSFYEKNLATVTNYAAETTAERFQEKFKDVKTAAILGTSKEAGLFYQAISDLIDVKYFVHPFAHKLDNPTLHGCDVVLPLQLVQDPPDVAFIADYESQDALRYIVSSARIHEVEIFNIFPKCEIPFIMFEMDGEDHLFLAARFEWVAPLI